MRILDDKRNLALGSVTILLKENEALEMIGYLEQLIAANAKGSEHFHLNNEDFSKEITLSVYRESDLANFSTRFKDLILNDE